MPGVLDAPNLGDLTFTLVGAGKVGASLAHWLAAAGARATAIGLRPGPAPAGRAGRELAAALGAGAVSVDALTSAGDGLLLVAVADDALDDLVRSLAARPQAAVVLHTAGGRGAGALSPLRGHGRAVGSFHPLKAFPRPLVDPAAARGVFFAIDGDPPAQRLGRRLATAWGATAAVVPEERRTLYHFAATLAAGGVTTLVAAADEMAVRLGLPPEAGRGYLELARGALAAVLPEGGGSGRGDHRPGGARRPRRRRAPPGGSRRGGAGAGAAGGPPGPREPAPARPPGTPGRPAAEPRRGPGGADRGARVS